MLHALYVCVYNVHVGLLLYCSCMFLSLQLSDCWYLTFWSCFRGAVLYSDSTFSPSLNPTHTPHTLHILAPCSQAIWENQFYYLFGFLFLVFVILVIACSEVSIVMTYFQLCGEDYHWWWRSFFLSGSASYYVLAYSVIYYYTKVSSEAIII